MADILIKHCTLRIVREGGWSWGEHPDRLVDKAVQALPQLLAEKLGHLWPGEAEAEISETVCIRVSIRMSELLGLSSRGSTSQPEANDLGERIDQAIRLALSSRSIDAVAEKETRNPGEPSSSMRLEIASFNPADAVFRLVLAWREQGDVLSRLAGFSIESLRLWYLEILHGRPLSRQSGIPENAQTGIDGDAASIGTPSRAELTEGILPQDAVLANEAREILDHCRRGFSKDDEPPIARPRLEELIRNLVPAGPAVRDEADVLRLRIACIAEAVLAFGLSPSDQKLQAALDRMLPFGSASVGSELISSTGRLRSREAVIALNETVSPERQSHVPSVPVQEEKGSFIEGARHIRTALPFLMLGVLHRLGYLDVLCATAAAANFFDDLALFAAALAYKVLQPPHRGWRRGPDDDEVAATFAGVCDPPGGGAMFEFARKLSAHVSPLDSFVSSILIDGHIARQPVLLHRTSLPVDGIAVIDVHGLFPVAWAASLPALTHVIDRLNRSMFFVPQGAGRHVADFLGQRGIRFMANSPAVRRCADEADVLWTTLMIERSCFGNSADFNIERAVGFATALALGTMAWRLWGKREPTTPLLALDRFSDLDATVRFDAHSVRVLLPLGRRHRDLLEHGFLNDIPGVPWLAGRRVQFSGG